VVVYFLLPTYFQKNLETSAKQFFSLKTQHEKAVRGRKAVYFVKTFKNNSKQAGKTVVASHGIKKFIHFSEKRCMEIFFF